MEDTQKALESDSVGDMAGELRAFLAAYDDEDNGDLPYVPIKEELVEEVMQQLWKEINSSQVSEIDKSSSPENPSEFPSSWEGNKESCGSTFSNSGSTLMTGIESGLPCFVRPTVDSTAGGMGWPSVDGNGLGVVEERGGGGGGGGGGVEGVEKMDGCDDGEESDHKWLKRLSSGGPQEVDEWA